MDSLSKIFDFEVKKPRWAIGGLVFLCIFFLFNSIYCWVGFFYLLDDEITWPLLVLGPASFGFFCYLFFWLKKVKKLWGRVQILDNPKIIIWSQNSAEIKKTGWNEVKELKIKFLWYRKLPPRYGLMLVWNDNQETFLLRGDFTEVRDTRRKIEKTIFHL